MTNTFQTVKETYKYTAYYSDINEGTVIFKVKNYGTVFHATPTKAQETRYGSLPDGLVTEPSTDRELLKLWNHATIERKYGVYATKPHLKKELESRGYILSDNKHRWKKPEIAE